MGQSFQKGNILERRRRDGSMAFQLRYRVRPPGIGEWEWQTETLPRSVTTKKQAERELANRLRPINDAGGGVVHPGSVRFSELVESYWPLYVANQNMRPGTLDAYAAMTCNSSCLNKIATCNGVSLGCANSSAIYYVTVVLDTNQLNNLANGLESAGFLTNSSQLAGIALRHELGHALSLGHPITMTPTCSATQTIMMGGAARLILSVVSLCPILRVMELS